MVSNGALPASSLAVIAGTSQQIRADLAPQLDAWRAAFHARFGKVLAVTDGYRSYAEQVAVFQRYYTTAFIANRPSRVWNGRRWYQRVGYPSAAVPGTSNHGLGVAVDLGSGVNTSLTSPEHLWCRQTAAAYGFTHPAWAHNGIDSDGTNEPWHFEATGVVHVSNAGSSTGSVTLPSVITSPIAGIEEDDDMALSDEGRQAVREEAREAVKEVLRAEEFQGYLQNVPIGNIAANVGGATISGTPRAWLGDMRVEVMQTRDFAAGLVAQVGALTAALSAVATGAGADLAAIQAAAKAGAEDALRGLTLTATTKG